MSVRTTKLTATSLLKMAVSNPQGDDLGKIEDLMIDTHDGKIEYAVVSFGGFFGLGDKLFAIPWQVITIDEENQCCVIGLDKERLEHAPGFDKDNWPDTADVQWRQLISDFYGN